MIASSHPSNKPVPSSAADCRQLVYTQILEATDGAEAESDAESDTHVLELLKNTVEKMTRGVS